MIRTAIVLFSVLASTAAFAAPNFAKEEAMVLELVRSSILDESDSMHTQVKKGATQYSEIRDENNDVIGYSLKITVEGYSYEQGNYAQTFKVEVVNGSVSKIVRI